MGSCRDGGCGNSRRSNGNRRRNGLSSRIGDARVVHAMRHWLAHRRSNRGLGSGHGRVEIWVSVSRRSFQHLGGAVEFAVHVVLSFTKFANSLAEALCEFGQLLCAEHDEDDHEYNQHIRTREVWQEREEVGREGIHKQVS